MTRQPVREWPIRHPLTAGWLWTLFWLVALLVCELSDSPLWLWVIASALCALPAIAATVVVLKNTPRTHLDAKESILGHFLIRFLMLVITFAAWTTSIVIGASVSATLQLAAENDEQQILATGYRLALASLPTVAILLWIGLIVRSSWFLTRLRGWGADAPADRIPPQLLVRHPRIRALVVGLAHPGLLLVAGLAAAAVPMVLSVVDVAAVVTIE